MDYLYYLGTASLVLRVVQHLRRSTHLPVEFMTVVHQLNGWVLRIRTAPGWTQQDLDNFRAFLGELGIPYQVDTRVSTVLQALESGQSPVEVMSQYQVAVIAHGSPDMTEIEAFRQQFIQGLGYCPETLA
ncbi:hypothetical protein HRE53_19270 [Acaryochloris sp. 'Moss Beach']|uniref:DUF732 domain-containing protein n=1 Tax=Acaryochloris TaxID=155977 RepID=UPI001BAFE96B|nr:MULTISPECIES: DUF732 domain-containing protein [Acaryochloris]QUY43845.1 hypothetical protein I1H34_06940 [Acaryochloris marina S15]UJB68626.1 hypothetical protein HRE53_19270 [Acaryochloris sp. 'Moss Beach']